MSDPNKTDSDVSTSRFAGISDVNGWWYASAALLLAVVLGIVLIVVLPSDGEDTPPGTAEPTGNTSPSAPLSSPASPDGTSEGGWSDLGCNGTEGSTKIPTGAPEATWRPLGPFSVPTHDRAGPTQVEGAVRQCYQHTPTGALFAAINIPYAIAAASSAEYASVVTELMTAGPGRESMLADGQITGSSGIYQVVAYRFDSCSTEQCNLRYIARSSGTLVEIPISVVWADGDWHLDGTSTGTGGGPAASVPPGFVNFEPGV